jgi:FkbM family methyltransferase
VDISQQKNVPAVEVRTEPQNFRGKVLGTLTSSALVRNIYAGCGRVPVLGRLLRGAAEFLFPAKKRVWVRIPSGIGKGLWLNIDPRYEAHFLEGGYESKVQELLAARLKPGDCFFDVGAHIGFFSLLASQLVGEQGKVVAFEPDPRNAAALRANAVRNNLPQFKPVEAAAWSSSGPLEFGRAAEASSYVQGQVTAISLVNDNRIQVNGLAIDDFVFRDGGAPAPNLIKIDVEGAEFEVLKGTAKVIKSAMPVVICEIHYATLVPEIDAWLSERGFLLYPLDDRKSFPTWLLAAPTQIQVPGWPPLENLPVRVIDGTRR